VICLLVDVIYRFLSAGQGIEQDSVEILDREGYFGITGGEALSVYRTDGDGVVLRIHFRHLRGEICYLEKAKCNELFGIDSSVNQSYHSTWNS